MSRNSEEKEKLQNVIRNSQIKNILAVRTQKLGDTITFIPTIEGIHRMFPSAHITLLCRKAGLEVARRIPYLGNILLVDDFKRDFQQGEWSYDLLFTSSQDSAWIRLKKQMNIKYAVGALPESMKGICLKHRLHYSRHFTVTERYKKNEHEVERNLKLLNFFRQKEINFKRRILWITSSERQTISSFLQGISSPLVVISPSGSKSSKNWSPDYFAVLCDQLISKRGVKIVIAGKGELSKEQSDKILKRMNKPASSIVDKTSFGELSALIERADLLISVDSGAAHVASFLNRPLVVLFGPGDLEQWRPWHNDKSLGIALKVPCKCGTTLDKCLEKKHCLDSLAPEEVFKAACKLLDRAKDIRNNPHETT